VRLRTDASADNLYSDVIALLWSSQMSFWIYIVGYLILIAGLAIGANMLHVPPQWIGVGVLCLVGVALMHGVTATKRKDPAP
jgi:hypothetical protein